MPDGFAGKTTLAGYGWRRQPALMEDGRGETNRSHAIVLLSCKLRCHDVYGGLERPSLFDSAPSPDGRRAKAGQVHLKPLNVRLHELLIQRCAALAFIHTITALRFKHLKTRGQQTHDCRRRQ